MHDCRTALDEEVLEHGENRRNEVFRKLFDGSDDFYVRQKLIVDGHITPNRRVEDAPIGYRVNFADPANMRERKRLSGRNIGAQEVCQKDSAMLVNIRQLIQHS